MTFANLQPIYEYPIIYMMNKPTQCYYIKRESENWFDNHLAKLNFIENTTLFPGVIPILQKQWLFDMPIFVFGTNF